MIVNCVICGAAFEPANPKRPARTCSRACTNRMVWREKPNRRCGPKPQPREIADCAFCGKPVKWAQRPSRQGAYCSRSCAGRAKSKGGISYGPDGRLRVRTRSGGQVLYSRVVMMDILGGVELSYDDVVHHINGDPTDDRPENLQLVTRSEHIALHREHITNRIREAAILRAQGRA